ncbi:hypothetical protein J3Q64DRAFT_1747085 [Phycomyces blakesleeanus]|uniref:Uncharacterized protein n=1 Tax=Phycomyces blakesleeanus TaxID=4837 RepID=A0ABR3AXH8_PHYBL
MQWRPFLLLVAGIATIYLASLLQDTPYPHPAKILISEQPKTRYLVDETVLTVANGYMYQTSIWFEASLQTSRGMKHGTGRMKTGVIGHLKQVRRPLGELLGKEDVLEQGWVETFKHQLRGPISSISVVPPSEIADEANELVFAVLYHALEDEEAQHFVRVYYLPKLTATHIPTFEYKDILLPGNTWVNAFSLEHHSILFSRDPDNYRFRVVSFPANITSKPHSADSEIVKLRDSKRGDPFGRWYQPGQLESHKLILTKLYSPDPETYRVFTMDFHQTTNSLYENITIVDDQKTITQLSELRGSVPEHKWNWRDMANLTYDNYVDDTSEYIGFVEVAKISQHERLKTDFPKLCFARSSDAKTVVFPLVGSEFLIIDYTDRIDLLEKDKKERKHLYKNDEGTYLPEYYYWSKTKLSTNVYDIQITGFSLNDRGNILALWTEHENIYIYKRGDADLHDTSKKQVLSIHEEDTVLEGGPKVVSQDGISTSGTKESSDRFLDEWSLRMVITPNERARGYSISTVGFINNTNSDNGATGNYICKFISTKSPGGVV